MGHVCRLAKGGLFLVLLSICACGDSVSEAPTGTEVAATERTTSITPVDFPNSSFFNSSSSLWAPQSSSSSQVQQGFSSPQMQPTSSSLWNSQTSSSSVKNIHLPNNGIPYVRIIATDSIDTEYVACTIEIAGNGQYEDITPAGARIRQRGNSTRLWYDKKPYRIKLDNKTSILGLPANKDWVLLANYRDQSKFMNAIAFDMARYMGSFPFVNANRFVEVEINGDYMGMYQLTEQIERATSRVDIDTSGLLLSLDMDDGPELSPDAGNNFYSKVYGMPVAVKYPKNISAERLETIATDFATLEQAIVSADYDNVQKLMDMESFIDFILLQEITRNVELEAPRSMHLYRDDTGKYHMGPVWDFDGGFGYGWDEDTKEYFTSQSWILGTGNPSKSPYNCTAESKNDWGMCNGTNTRFNNYDGRAVPGFFTNMFANGTFLAAYRARWESHKNGILADAFAKLDAYVSQTAIALENDATRWPPIRRYDTEIQTLKKWLAERADNYSSVLMQY
ncbi:CotH protein [Fibrobacter sp. UWOV1]|uniref:CotH kinase family protein n=1 Tax=Fibrobacter sp. UWOV1 TaxID=1896215 RepID=UPI000912F431|nr:CotH kinase family protein [Fibrobacter sp. UWOV1]SHK77882.1 CotH protein [Fibrobacter sp. UWOV1]